MGYVSDIARYVEDLTYEELPPRVLDRLRTCLLYNLSLGLAAEACEDPTFDAFSHVFTAPGECGVLGVQSRTRAPLDAAALNAALITARGQNDTYQQTVTHVGCIVIPAVLAIAQTRGLGSRDVLTAMAVGYEVVPKIARHVAGASIARGFRSTPVYSVFGAAAASAKALGLTRGQTANALAIASNFSSGLLQCWEENTPEWRLHIAHACRSGMQAALLAEQGMAGASEALEGANGFYRAFAGVPGPLHLAGWDILALVFKPYPGCAFNQAAIHTLRAMLRDERIAVGDIESIRIFMSLHDAGYPGVMPGQPIDSVAGARMSAPFMAAATLQDGAPRWRHFLHEYASPGLQSLARLVSVAADPSVADWQCKVEVRLHNGSHFLRELDDPAEFSWTWKDVVAAMEPLAEEWAVPNARARFDRWVDLLAAFGSQGTVPDLLALAFDFLPCEGTALGNNCDIGGYSGRS